MVQQIKTVHKFGLTGTLPDNKPDEWNIIGKIGSIIYEKDMIYHKAQGAF